MSQLDLFSNSEGDPAEFSSALPDYRVRESKRAKRVSNKISVEGEVEVVVPPNFDTDQLPHLLERRRDWIEKTRSRLSKTAQKTATDWSVAKPESIVLRWRSSVLDDPGSQQHSPTHKSGRGFGSDRRSKRRDGSDLDTHKLEIWSVQYQRKEGNKTLCVPSLGNRLTLQGNTEHLPSCQAVLKKWLAHRAHRELAPWLRQLGFELDLPCRRISVRGQKTRWASCSSQKDISLNYKLLFLPRPLVHYVLVHELCHTEHMNHSRQFWALVEEKQPNYQQWRDQIKTGWRYVPRWVEA
ncbi:MAG: M48 family metallopeptidase [Phormidesmis sp.]